MRIAIVNDVLIAIEALRRAVVRDGKHEIAWIAQDGAEAVERCRKDKPDLILMDLFMPGMDGIDATRSIMAESPCAIMVATANVPDHPGKVFEAMSVGALDAVSIPVWGEAEKPDGGRELLAKIATIEKLVRPVQRSRERRSSKGEKQDSVQPPNSRPLALVAIGASAGGPSAVTTILSGLPANFPATIVVVQHVDKQFAPGLMEWFAKHSRLKVRVAEEGDSLEAGTLFLAGRDRHLILVPSLSNSKVATSTPSSRSSPLAVRMGYSLQPVDCSYRPSVDVFFKSVARHWRGKAIGVLLTGMGRDGAEGLKALRDVGHHTISQDKGSSAVYGMPKAAAELDAASEILPLDKIAPRLTSLLLRP